MSYSAIVFAMPQLNKDGVRPHVVPSELRKEVLDYISERHPELDSTIESEVPCGEEIFIDFGGILSLAEPEVGFKIDDGTVVKLKVGIVDTALAFITGALKKPKGSGWIQLPMHYWIVIISTANAETLKKELEAGQDKAAKDYVKYLKDGAKKLSKICFICDYKWDGYIRERCPQCESPRTGILGGV